MGLGVEHVVVETHEIGLRKGEIEILERLRGPEALHLVFLHGLIIPHVVDGGMAEVGASDRVDVLEHAPCGVLVELVS